MSKEKEDTAAGFFRKLHDTVEKSVDSVTVNNFANLETDSKRVYYVSNLPVLENYDIAAELEKYPGIVFPVQKDLEKARQFKYEGNDGVKKGDWGKAMQCYSQSLVFMPSKESEELSIVYANRSAALNHLEQHQDALDDIQRCLELGYPKNLRYKVYERKARCLLVLKRHTEAIVAFQETVKALDEASEKLDKEKRIKMGVDAKIMIEIINKGRAMSGNLKDPEPLRRTPPKPKLNGQSNRQYPAASDAIKIEFEESKGRYAVATRDISAGEIILVENPHCGVLLAEYKLTHCQNCFVKCAIPLPCPNCSNVIFCSEKCKEDALKSYHKYECPILPIIWKSGSSITCHMALRIITQKPKEYFKNNKEFQLMPDEVYKTNDYKTVYNLVTHEEKRTKADLLHRTEMAVFLVKLLQLSGYFDGGPRKTVIQIDELRTLSLDKKYADDVLLFGGLLLRNLQILQFNAHEAFELECSKPNIGKNVLKHEGQTVFLGGAVFPTLALFNHSCDPSNVRRYWVHPMLMERKHHGAFHTLVQKQLMEDDKKFEIYFRMQKETFYKMLHLLHPKLQHQDTNMRSSISPAERLAVTLRYFCGSTIVVRAIKNISKGDEVAENYGPMFSTVPKEKRQSQLKDQYWFDCKCKPCVENWPLYSDMVENYMRFKCDSDRPCPNVIAVAHNCQEFMVKCGLCNQYTNILKGLKSLQDTDMIYRLAQSAMNEGKYGEAMKKLLEVLKLYDETLAPPYRSYYDCVQALRRTMLAMGNYNIK